MNEYPALVIDDDVWMQRIISKVLEGFGFTTYIASNGFDGVALALEHRPLIIFLDIMMPELSGHLTLKMLKRLRTTKDIAVIMISALSDAENLGLAVKMGAVGFISKPFTRATVLDKLRNILGAETLAIIAKKSQMPLPQNPGFPPEPDAAASTVSSAYSGTTYQDTEDTPRVDHAASAEATKRYQEESNQKQVQAIKDLLFKEIK